MSWGDDLYDAGGELVTFIVPEKVGTLAEMWHSECKVRRFHIRLRLSEWVEACKLRYHDPTVLSSLFLNAGNVAHSFDRISQECPMMVLAQLDFCCFHGRLLLSSHFVLDYCHVVDIEQGESYASHKNGCC